MEYVLCSSCSFPILADHIEQDISCPSCHQKGIVMLSKEVKMRGKTTNLVSTKIGGPGPGILEFIFGVVIGTVFAPVIISATKEGRSYLARLVEEKLRK